MKLNKNLKCSDELFRNLKEFQDGREAARQELEIRLKKLELAKGSKYYEEETKKAHKAYSDALTALLSKYEGPVFTWLDNMIDQNATRKFEPITAEDERTLNIVKERIEQGHISENDLDMLYNSLSDSPLARSLFDDYAAKAGFLKSYRGDQPLTLNYVRDTIRELAKGAREFLETDDNPRVSHVMQARANLYGETGQEIPKRDLFCDKKGMFRELLPSFPSEVVDAFCDCVD